jgi:hypothetical protein
MLISKRTAARVVKLALLMTVATATVADRRTVAREHYGNDYRQHGQWGIRS